MNGSISMLNSRYINDFNTVRALTVLFSLLLSVMLILTDDIINADGILYVNMAQAFLGESFDAMANLYNWPLLALLMAGISKITGLHAETSAYVLNTVLFVILTDTLLRISKFTLQSPRQIAITAILILSFYTLNEYRNFIIRDIGYWAFIFLGILQLLKYSEDQHSKYLYYWQIYTVIAVLFRIEGVVLLAALPTYFLFNQRIEKRFVAFFTCYTVPFILALIAIILFITNTSIANGFTKIESVLYYAKFSELFAHHARDIAIVSDQIINPIAEDQAALLLNSGIIGMVIFTILSGLSVSIIALYLIFRGIETDSRLNHNYKILISTLIGFNLIILLIFVFKQQFISTRYCMTAIVGLFLLVLPRISSGIEFCMAEKRRLIVFFSALFILMGLFDTFHKSSSKAYIKSAAINAAHILPNDAIVLTNDYFIQYYLEQNNSNIKVNIFTNAIPENTNYIFIVKKSKNNPLEMISSNLNLKNVIETLENKYSATLYLIDT